MKKRIYRIVKEKCGIPQVGARWALVVTMIAASVTVGVALAQRRPARFERPGHDERMAAEERERYALAEGRANLKARTQELKARFDEVKTELAELEESGKGQSERAKTLRGELRDLEVAMARLERELHELEGQRREHEMRPWNVHEPRNEIIRRLEELNHETESLLQGLAEQRIGRNDETNMLYNRMRELNEQMRQVRQQLGRQLKDPDRPRREFDERERDNSRRIQQAGRQVYTEAMILEQEELKEKARNIELELKELVELGDENPERVEKLHTEVREIHKKIMQIDYDAFSLRNLEMEHKVFQPGLQEHARQLEHRLQELGDSHPEEAQELRMQLDKIHQQMQRSRSELDRLRHRWPRDEGPMQPDIERHRRQLMARRAQIQAQMRELELLLRELNGQEKAESEDAHLHKRELRDLQKLLQETENELRKSQPGREQERGRDDLEREVQNLRKQMDGMNEQMGEMRELMKRLLEKNETQQAL